MEYRGIDQKNSGVRKRVGVYAALLLFAFVTFWGCKSKKVVLNDGSVMQITYADLIQDLNKNVGKFNSIYYPKVRYTVTYNGNTNQFTGSLSIKKGEEIYATVNAFLGIEVAKVLMNKDSIIIKSNFERKLYILDYNEMIKKFGLSGDFSTIENVLCYQLSMFKPNLYDYQVYDKSFVISPKDKIKSKVEYDHVTANYVENTYKITEISYCSKGINDCLNVSYDKFVPQKQFVNPTFIQIANNNKDANVEMVLGKASFNSKIEHKLGNISNFEVIRY